MGILPEHVITKYRRQLVEMIAVELGGVIRRRLEKSTQELTVCHVRKHEPEGERVSYNLLKGKQHFVRHVTTMSL